MKKRRLIFLLPIAAMALGACGKKNDSNNSGSEESGEQEHHDDEEVTLTIDSSDFELTVGETKQLHATLSGAEGTLEWKSDGETVATVDETGKVTAIGKGTANISVSYGEHVDFVKVTVKEEERVDSITIAQAIALMDEAGDGNVVQGLKQVTGICGANTEYNSQYKEYSGSFEGHSDFKIQFKDPKNILNGGSAVGMEVVIEGYLEKYQGKYQLSYLPAKSSPTGEKFTPSLVSAKAVEHDAALESITVSNAHREFYQNAAFVGETVTAHYSDGSTGVVNATFTGYNMATLGEQTVTVSYTEKGVTKTVTYKITVSEKAVVNYGTEASPLSVTQALAIMNNECPNNDDMTEQAITFEGEISEIKNTFHYDSGPCFELNVTDGTNSVYVYRCHSTEEQEPNVKVGATVKIVGFAKNFKGTLEFVDNGATKCHFLYVSGGEPVVDKEIVSVDSVAVGYPTEVVVGTTLNAADFQLNVTYDDESTGVVTATEVSGDTSVVAESVEVTVYYKVNGEEVGHATVNIKVKEKPADPVIDKTFSKISSIEELVDGNYLIESNGYVFSGVDELSGAVAATISEGTITGVEGMAAVEIKAMTGGYSVKVVNGKNAGKYMSGTAGSNTINFSDTPSANTITFAEGVPTITSNSTSIQFNNENANCRFRYYKSTQKAIALYLEGVLEPELKEIEVTKAPSKVEYYAGEKFDATGMVVTAKYTHGGEDKVLQASEYTIDKTTLALGDKYVIVSYKEGEITKTAQVPVTVTKAPVSVTGVKLNKTELSMKVNEEDFTLEATVEPVDADDPTVTWSLSKEGVVTVNNGVLHAVADGVVTVTATAGDCHADCVVTVAPADKVLSGIEVTTQPAKTEYVAGESFDPTDMVVTASYSSGHVPEPVTGYTFSTAPLKEADTTVEIDYNGQKAYVTITVSPAPVLDSISVANAQGKTAEYTVGDVISKDDIVVTAHYTQGKQDAVVTDYTISKTTALAAEDTSVTITYVEGGVEKTTAYNFTVNPLPHVNSVKAAYEAFLANPSSTEAYEFEGMVVGTKGNSFYVQDGDYGILVYNKAVSGNQVGKQVKIKSTLKIYNGLVETDSVSSASIVTDGDMVMPSAKAVSNATELSSTNQNTLINVSNLEVISKESSWASGTTNNWKVKINGTETTLSLDKFAFNQTNKNVLSGLNVGDQFTITNAVVGYYKATQIAITSESVVAKFVSPVTSITLGGDMTKKEYGPGSNWNYSGITCTATLENGGTKSLSFNELTIVSLSADAPAEGVTSLTIDVKVTAYPDVTGSITINGLSFTEKQTTDPINYSMALTKGTLPDGWTNSSGKAFSNTYWNMNAANASLTGKNLFSDQTSIDVTIVAASSKGTNAAKDNVLTVYGIDSDGNEVDGAIQTIAVPADANYSSAGDALKASHEYKVTLTGEGITGVKIVLTTKNYNVTFISCSIVTTPEA